MNQEATRQYCRDSLLARRLALLIIALNSFLVPLALSASIPCWRPVTARVSPVD